MLWQMAGVIADWLQCALALQMAGVCDAGPARHAALATAVVGVAVLVVARMRRGSVV